MKGTRAILLGWLVAAALPALAADTGARSHVALAGVTGLERPVTLTETKIALGDLVGKVAAETGVTLAAARDVADEPVAVVVKALPAHELLDRLAELLGYRWSQQRGKEAPVYEIWQDLVGRRHEDALREAVSTRARRSLETEIRRRAAIAALPLERLRQIAEERAPEASERAAIARQLFDPVPRVLARLLGGLTPLQWARLCEEGALLFATEPGPGELRLPEEATRALRACRPDLYPSAALSRPPRPVSDGRARQQEEMQAQWTAATGYRVQLRLEEGPAPSGRTLGVTAEACPVLGGAPVGNSFWGVGPGTRLSVSAVTRNPRPVEIEDALPPHARPANDPLFRVRRRFLPAAVPGGATVGPSPRLQELLPSLAATYGVHFIADAYWGTPRFAPALWTGEQPMTLDEVLERYAGSSHRWEFREKVALLRSRTWFLDRVCEVPLRLVRRWEALCEREGTLTLDAWAELAATLSDGQLASLSGLAGELGLPPEFSTAHAVRHLLRLWASLSPAQRLALWERQTLLLPQMSPGQQRLFLASLRAQSRFRFRGLKPDPRAVGALSLFPAPSVQVRERQGRTIRYRLERSLPVRPAAGVSATSAFPASPRDAVTCYPVLQVRLQLEYGPDVRETVSITAAPPARRP
jgi:hypothetical protein